MKRLLLLLLASACAASGERTSGGCPADEICAPLNGGLYFVGAALGDEVLTSDGWAAPHPTALGGWQAIRLLSGPFVSSPAFDQPFVAASGGGALAVAAQAGSDVDIVGAAIGASYLRIVQPGTGWLYDRILLDVKPVASARIAVPADAPTRPSIRDGRFALWAGRALPVVVALTSDDGDRVVDEGMTVNGVGGASSWDVFIISAPPGDSVLDVGAGDVYLTASVLAVADTDDVRLVTATPAGAEWQELCFQASAAGISVYGAPYAFAPRSPGDDVQPATAENCVLARGGGVTVYSGTTVRSFLLGPTFSAMETAGGGGAPVAAPGERAAAF